MGGKRNPYKDIKLNKSQQRVFDYLVEHKSITSMEAIKELGETRLGARVFEMREKNINISSEMIEVTNRYKEKRHVKRYYLG